MRRPKAAQPPRPRNESGGRIVQIAIILAAVLLCYWPVITASFVWDDDILVTGNPLIQSASGLAEIWSGGRAADYFPITNTIFWIGWHLFGHNPIGFHVLNICLQAADALLVWLVLDRLKVPGAWLAALLFAVHPVNAESVAWISELKNVLAMFFALLSLLCFLEIEDHQLIGSRRVAYAASICFFILALLSKSQVAFLPAVLLLCAWWRAGNFKSAAFRREGVRTWPFFVGALVLGLVTIWIQNRDIGSEEIITGSLGRRVVNAGLAVWWYIAKVFFPVRLIAIYPPWRFDSPRPVEWLPLAGLIAMMVVLWRGRNGVMRGAFFALACFLITLLPVLGFVRMGYLRSGTLVSDHFQYFGIVALVSLFAAAVTMIWKRGRSVVRFATIALIIAVFGALGAYTNIRAAVFRNEETLWLDTLSKNPDAWQAQIRLGRYYFNQERYAEALPHLQRAVELKPQLAEHHTLLGVEYCRLERFTEGIAELRQALQMKLASSSNDTHAIATIRTDLANALGVVGNNLSASSPTISNEAMQYFDEAVNNYESALLLEPEQPAIHRNLGLLLARLGRFDEALAHLRTTLRIVPNEPTARETIEEIEARRSQK